MSRLRHNLPGKSAKAIMGLGAILVLVGLGLYLTRPADLGPASVALPNGPAVTMPPLLAAFPSQSPTLNTKTVAIASLAPSPSATPAPTPTPTPVVHAATRIIFTQARVDLPIITAPINEKFPACDVAERMAYYDQPGAGAVIYLYAHATHYMFGGLLAASWRADSYLLGQEIQIYTDDDLVYTYAVTEIHRHQAYNSFDVANALVGEALVLQACENNDATGPKLIVVARPVSVAKANHATAHPPTAPRACAHGY
jgi:hypothetical protein